MVNELKEETLDPENWDELRILGHKMLDDLIDHIIDSKTQPARLAAREEIQELTVPLAREGEGSIRIIHKKHTTLFYGVKERSFLESCNRRRLSLWYVSGYGGQWTKLDGFTWIRCLYSKLTGSELR